MSGAAEEYDAWSQAGSDSSDDGEDNDILLFDDLGDIDKTKTVPTGLVARYKPDWGPREGFREAFQNWRDAICRSSNLTLDQFAPNITETQRHILIEVRHPTQAQSPLLGFIRFQRDGDDNGVLEVTNFNAKLYMSHLSLGGTTKARDKTQTGKHGEGLKLAALAFRRYPCNCTFRIEASSFRWNTSFRTDRQLQFRLTRCNPDTIMRQRRAVKNKPRTTKAHIWEDVKVVIGAPARRSRGKDQGQIKSRKIPLVDFREWLKVTLDLDPPDDLIRTADGDLIMSDSHAGKLYLQGLRLPHGSATGMPFRYGYNLRDGEVDRDRRCLSDTFTDAKTITNIWAKSIRSNHGKGDILPLYTALLMEDLRKVADVMLDGDTQRLDRDIATRVWGEMLKKGQKQHGQGVFYFIPSKEQDDMKIIQKNLQLHPVPISETLWKLLSAHQLCRTPMEEQEHRLSRARVVQVFNDPFAQHTSWFLKCCFGSNALTKHIKWEFVEGRDLGLDVVWVQNIIKIHDKWIEIKQAQEGSFCHDDTPSDDPFAYDDVVLWLWDLILSQLASSGQHTDIVRHERWLKGMARTRLAQAPRGITCLSTSRRGELAVKWTFKGSHTEDGPNLRIILHTDDCPRRLDILSLRPHTANGPSDELEANCS
ncbi:hypothetical protein P171DRAFT_248227 [Karstenula rhodostoma CBS 690.94]|uniref:Uncharacterized protein n=1 Tax=Karstenula rhodostoma CBS 690.94 TaxID=1392251 RepID=A0A9P4PND2_9PLEO|nr:hypothetical protein P171DRAFT_248227 [Karstenula rhodostoma CBS 690.94]